MCYPFSLKFTPFSLKFTRYGLLPNRSNTRIQLATFIFASCSSGGRGLSSGGRAIWCTAGWRSSCMDAWWAIYMDAAKLGCSRLFQLCRNQTYLKYTQLLILCNISWPYPNKKNSHPLNRLVIKEQSVPNKLSSYSICRCHDSSNVALQAPNVDLWIHWHKRHSRMIQCRQYGRNASEARMLG